MYEHLCYVAEFPRIATLRPEFAGQTVSIGSIGKTFNATGWRLGFAIGDENLVKYVQNAHTILSYTTAGPAQIAAAKGLEMAVTESFWDDNRRETKRKIDALCETFKELGLMVSAIHPLSTGYRSFR